MKRPEAWLASGRRAFRPHRPVAASTVPDLDLEALGEARSSGRRYLERAAARYMLEPCELEQTIQNPCPDDSLEVIATLAPIEARLAEDAPAPRHQVNAERGKETLARGRDLAAVIGEHDVPFRDERFGHTDAYPARQVVIAGSRSRAATSLLRWPLAVEGETLAR